MASSAPKYFSIVKPKKTTITYSNIIHQHFYNPAVLLVKPFAICVHKARTGYEVVAKCVHRCKHKKALDGFVFCGGNINARICGVADRL